MGVEAVTARFLVYCKMAGVDFSRTCTLGRQSLYVDRRELQAVLEESGLNHTKPDFEKIFGNVNSNEEIGFSDNFFRFLGAVEVASIDASGYEHASIIHDMNKGIGSEYCSSFSVVVDGGTLEHIFNFPIAIENCMKMLELGGHFISVAPANNYFGHGFYQFSSELFFRVFTRSNGFEVGKVFLVAEKPFRSWYEVPDPSSVRERIFLRNQVSTLQLFYAKKVLAQAGLHEVPQQSDYKEILWQGANEEWTAHGDKNSLRRAAKLRRIACLMPLSMVRFLRAMRPMLTGLRPPFRHKYLRRVKA